MKLEKLGSLDRRWIFFTMALAIVIPLLVPLRLPFAVNPPSRDMFEAIEKLKPGAKVVVSADYDPGSKPELEPFTYAVLRHLFRKKARVVIMELWPAAPPMMDAIITDVVKGFPELKYGQDYVHLGFQEGKEFVMRGVAESFVRTYPLDAQKTPLAQLQLMRDLPALRDADLMVAISGGYPGLKEWVQHVQSRYHLQLGGAATAVGALDYRPYYQSKQLVGLVEGMRGAAEYEKLVGQIGDATKGMDAQSAGHSVIVLAVVLANIAYFQSRRKGAK